MEDGETSRMHKYGESKTAQIMMATVRHVTSSSGLREFQADGFLFVWVYMVWFINFLKPSGNYTYKTFNIQKFYVDITWNLWEFCMDLGEKEQQILPHKTLIDRFF